MWTGNSLTQLFTVAPRHIDSVCAAEGEFNYPTAWRWTNRGGAGSRRARRRGVTPGRARAAPGADRSTGAPLRTGRARARGASAGERRRRPASRRGHPPVLAQSGLPLAGRRRRDDRAGLLRLRRRPSLAPVGTWEPGKSEIGFTSPRDYAGLVYLLWYARSPMVLARGGVHQALFGDLSANLARRSAPRDPSADEPPDAPAASRGVEPFDFARRRADYDSLRRAKALEDLGAVNVLDEGGRFGWRRRGADRVHRRGRGARRRAGSARGPRARRSVAVCARRRSAPPGPQQRAAHLLAARADSPTLVCSAGWPSLAASRLLDLLVAGGTCQL